jgi:hypothetical protein
MFRDVTTLSPASIGRLFESFDRVAPDAPIHAVERSRVLLLLKRGLGPSSERRTIARNTETNTNAERITSRRPLVTPVRAIFWTNFRLPE